MKLRGYILGVLSAVSYGLIPIFILPIKQAHFSMDITLFYRFFFSALMLGGYLIYSRQNFRINKKEALILAILGICYALSSEFLFLGYDFLTPGIASTVLFIYPIIVALIMFFFYKERLTKLSVGSLLLAFIGVIILCLKGNGFEINFAGLGIVMLSSLFYALYMVIVNKSHLKVSGFKLTFYSMLFTSLFFMTKSFIGHESFVIPSTTIFFNFLIFAFLTTVISSLCLVYAIKNIGSTPVAVLGALEPVVAVMVSVCMFNEKFTFNLLIGITLILLGVILNVISDRKNTAHA
ncbi:DMT family transporter [Chryseobacterium indologenes]|uniref:DMT family transporter n=1 Tax=Chryseobacterium indologenes TaxID=253 RepID=A0A1Z3W0K8_CHRID|nr:MULTISPECIES: DMT family transporter [Chryseobacterium]ASE61316.1 EamA/RhaT family transporter [Chryseobacterium indologenes]ATN05398.1 EamA/RhaT family transporter [Chryseobacterium indologenes]AYY85842.1 DMT family transporter [Chryseobacterium indologenes]AYZ35613.1 DMT family transporter [Chryseobacterium indologenes]AZB16987.1 DMT family transporter [Chryseobacterium indologenes]